MTKTRALALAALMGALQTWGCVHGDWPAEPRASMAPNQVVLEEANLFSPSAATAKLVGCDTRLLRVRFSDACAACGAVRIAIDDAPIAHAIAPSSRPERPDDDAWVRPRTPPRHPEKMNDVVAQVDARAPQRLELASNTCVIESASVPNETACGERVVEARCTVR